MIPYSVARIPLGTGASNKLRTKLLDVYRNNPTISTSLVTNVFHIFGTALSEEDPAAKKNAEGSMMNLFFLLQRMYESQSQLLLDQIKVVIPTLGDERVTLILTRLLKVPPAEKTRNIIMVILGQCVVQSKYSLLIDLMQKHQIVKTLTSHLKMRESQNYALTLLQFFLVGFQVTPAAFHAALPELLKILQSFLATSSSPTPFMKNFMSMLIILMGMFPGYPVQYTPVVNTIKEMINKFHVEIPTESDIQAAKKQSWFSLTQQLTGSCATNYAFSYSFSENTSGYKGLANTGNSKSV